MTVDHVVPTALGGSDDPTNLVAACKDCNAGKSASNPDAPLVADVAADTLRWGKAIEQAAAGMLADLATRDELRGQFAAKWNSWKTSAGESPDLPGGWQRSIDNFIGAGLPMPLLLECVDIAMGNDKLTWPNIFRYMCGVAWGRVTELQEAARRTADGQLRTREAAKEDATDPILDVLDEFVVSAVVTALGGDKRSVSLAAQCLWQVAQASQMALRVALDSGEDSDGIFDACREAGSDHSAWFISNLMEHHRSVERCIP
jgi:hypothetical protein